jgi:hypothetical protein
MDEDSPKYIPLPFEYSHYNPTKSNFLSKIFFSPTLVVLAHSHTCNVTTDGEYFCNIPSPLLQANQASLNAAVGIRSLSLGPCHREKVIGPITRDLPSAVSRSEEPLVLE